MSAPQFPTYEYITLDRERNFADVITVKGLDMEEYPGCSRRIQCNHRILKSGKGGAEGVREDIMKAELRVMWLLFMKREGSHRPRIADSL